jgi:hypothetical protein
LYLNQKVDKTEDIVAYLTRTIETIEILTKNMALAVINLYHTVMLIHGGNVEFPFETATPTAVLEYSKEKLEEILEAIE